MALKKVGALWKSKNGNGWNGKLEQSLPKDTRILIFEQKEKKQPNHPDLQVFISEDEPTPPPQDNIDTEAF